MDNGTPPAAARRFVVASREGTSAELDEKVREWERQGMNPRWAQRSYEGRKAGYG